MPPFEASARAKVQGAALKQCLMVAVSASLASLASREDGTAADGGSYVSGIEEGGGKAGADPPTETLSRPSRALANRHFIYLASPRADCAALWRRVTPPGYTLLTIANVSSPLKVSDPPAAPDVVAIQCIQKST